MSNEDSFEYEGIVRTRPDFQFVPSGQMKTVLNCYKVKAFNGKEVDSFFELFGRPAETLEKKNVTAGTLVRVAFELDSFKGFNKLRAWRVDVRTNQNPGLATDDLPPKSKLEPLPESSSDDDSIPF